MNKDLTRYYGKYLSINLPNKLLNKAIMSTHGEN